MPADRLDFLRDDHDGLSADIGETLDQGEKDEWHWNWPLWARAAQLPPDGDWRVWLVMAGRGFGKTRAGAEWVRTIAECDHDARIALVGASLHEARAVSGANGCRCTGSTAPTAGSAGSTPPSRTIAACA